MAHRNDHLFKEASYMTLFKGPHYKPWHLRFKKAFGSFIDTELMPYAHKWDEECKMPHSIYKLTYNKGFYSLRYPIKYGGQLFENKYQMDSFSKIIQWYEFSRLGVSGLKTTLYGAKNIGLPPLMNHGSEFLKNKYAKPVICADKLICLAVSEPAIGSDVSSLKTTAIDDPKDPNYFRVNGEKYFISNGNKANYYTTAVKYKDKIMALLIDRDFVDRNNKENGYIMTSRMATQGWCVSDTAYITFKNTKVSKENVIGKMELGWKVFMTNFNFERFEMCIGANGLARTCLNDAIDYARDRETFGKKLIRHQVIRHKLVEMIRKIESTHYMIERCAYLLEELNNNMDLKNNEEKRYKFMKYLSAMVALTKVQSSKTLEFCAREAVQIFGGRGCIRNGRGQRVERIYREVRVFAIGGGSEEILTDFVSRQAKL